MDNQQDFLVEQNNELLEACEEGDLEDVIKLIEEGANVNTKDVCGNTPLHFASFNNYFEIVELLLENGSKIEVKDDYGDTPLLFASSRGHFKIVKLFLENGADPTIKNNDGNDFLSLIKDDQKRKSIEEFLFEMNSSLIKG